MHGLLVKGTKTQLCNSRYDLLINLGFDSFFEFPSKSSVLKSLVSRLVYLALTNSSVQCEIKKISFVIKLAVIS